jgi:hypothetical protein
LQNAFSGAAKSSLSMTLWAGSAGDFRRDSVVANDEISIAVMRKPISPATLALGLVGGAVGGIVGYFAFFWIAHQGFYAIVLPPGLLGLCAGLGARRRSVLLASISAMAGLVLGLFIEWKFAPFVVDGSLRYFVTHLHALRPLTLLMIALGTILSYRLALSFESLGSNR